MSHAAILPMSLLRFCALTMLGPLLSMEDRELSDFIKNILICVSKMNRGIQGLERYKGE